MKSNDGPRYAIVSYDSRRDLEDPMRFFQALDVVHLYRRAPWGDMVAADHRPSTITYSNPIDLYRTLRGSSQILFRHWSHSLLSPFRSIWPSCCMSL